jgi:hypothetical protein
VGVREARCWAYVLVGVLVVSTSIGCGDDDPYRAVCDVASSMEASPEGYPVDEVARRLDRLREVAPDQMRKDLDSFIAHFDGSSPSTGDAAATERVRVVLSDRCHADLAILGVAVPKSPTG